MKRKQLKHYAGNKNPSSTKKGPGRIHLQDEGGGYAHRTFADNLMKVWADKRVEQMRKQRGSLT